MPAGRGFGLMALMMMGAAVSTAIGIKVWGVVGSGTGSCAAAGKAHRLKASEAAASRIPRCR